MTFLNTFALVMLEHVHDTGIFHLKLKHTHFSNLQYFNLTDGTIY